MSEPIAPRRAEEFLDELIDAIAAMHESLKRRAQAQHIANRRNVDTAVGYMAAMALRHLKAARNDQRNGWAPESVGHIRAAWEAGIDLSFLLSKSGEERWRTAEQYVAMLVLRIPGVHERMANRPETVSSDLREAYEKFAPKYSDSPAMNPRQHWSGENKGDVREAAYGQLDRVLEGGQMEGAAKLSKQLLFEDHASPSVHADPGSWLWLPTDSSGWPLVDPAPEHAPRQSPSAFSGCWAALIVLFGVVQRASAEEKARASQLVREFNDLFITAEE